MKKAIKIISVILFVGFYVLSVATSNFPYPEYAENPILSYVLSLLALFSFLFLTFAFCQSKKYLISLSVFWMLFVGSVLLNIFIKDTMFSGIIDLVIDLPLIIYALPLIHFDRGIEYLCEILKINRNNEYIVFIHLGIVVALFYATYFISRKIVTKKIKDKTKKDIS